MNPDDFKTLQDYWYALLADTGFVDIERDVEGSAMLREFASNSYRQTKDVQHDARFAYFTCMSAHLDDETLTDFDRDILRMHILGSTRVEIARALDRHPRTIRYHIRRMETQFGIRHWDKWSMTSAPRKPEPVKIKIRRKAP